MSTQTTGVPALQSTASGTVTYPDTTDATAKTAPELDSLNRRTSGLRDEVSLVAQDVEDVHHKVAGLALGDRAARLNASLTLPAMLDDIADRGLSWAEIADTAGVTPAAVRKWRRGENATGPKRLAVAELLALMDTLSDLAVAEPAAFLISPVHPEAVVTFLEVYRAGRADLVLDLACQRKSATEVLDAYDGSWRDTLERRFVVELDDDGMGVLVRR
jgi:transcriptional regulator with XRE-family HTH domain